MSIISSICADESNMVKSEWVRELRAAYQRKDWELVRIILLKMDDYFFFE